MYDPKLVFTKAGLEEYKVHLFNIKQALFYITNHADDLHIGALSDEPLDTLYQMQKVLDSKVLENGDGETHPSLLPESY